MANVEAAEVSRCRRLPGGHYQGQARIAAEGICFANGVAVDEKEEFVYVAETMKKRILRYRISDDSSVGEKKSTDRNRWDIWVFPTELHLMKRAISGWHCRTKRDRLYHANANSKSFSKIGSTKVLRRPANICFGGEKRKTAFIGSLNGTNIPYFPVPYPGMRLIHQKI